MQKSFAVLREPLEPRVQHILLAGDAQRHLHRWLQLNLASTQHSTWLLKSSYRTPAFPLVWAWCGDIVSKECQKAHEELAVVLIFHLHHTIQNILYLSSLVSLSLSLLSLAHTSTHPNLTFSLPLHVCALPCISYHPSIARRSPSHEERNRLSFAKGRCPCLQVQRRKLDGLKTS